MKNWTKLFIILTLATCAYTFALPPVKSHICLSFIRQLKALDTVGRFGDNSHTMSRLHMLNVDLEGVAEDGGLAEGLITSQHSSLVFSKKAAASRIKGIREFAQVSEGASLDLGNFTRTLNIQGDKEIHVFLDDFRLVLEEAGRIITKPLHWDNTFTSQLKKLENILNIDEDDQWALLSRNFIINRSVGNQALHGSNDDALFHNQIRRQSKKEVLPLVEFLQNIMPGYNISENGWMGLDLF